MANLGRRDFLVQVTVGVGAALTHNVWAEVKQPPLRSPTQQVPLGKTGITVSLVGLDTGMRGWMRQSNHTRMGYPAFERLVLHACERGINFFDAADLYGTHPFLRDALKGLAREKFVLQTKIWFAPWGLVDVQLARINHRGVAMDGKPDEIVPILKQMQAKGKGVVGMKIFGEGRFKEREQREASLRFVLTQRCVDAFIIGFEEPEEIDETLAIMKAFLKEQGRA